MKAVTAALVACVVILGSGAVGATTPPDDDELTIEQLKELEEVFVEAAQSDYGAVDAIACSVADGEATCYGRTDSGIIVGTGAWNARRPPTWSLASFVEVSAASTTTTPATTTTPVDEPHVGIVWESMVDPARVNQAPESQPRFDVAGAMIEVQQLLRVSTDGPGELASDCRDAARSLQQERGGPLAETCLRIQIAFDVHPDAPEPVYVTLDNVLTAAGQQIDVFYSVDGVPGARDRGLIVTVPGAGPDSRLAISVSGADGFEDFTYDVPPIDYFQPFNFD